MIKDLFVFSVKSLRKRKLRSWLTMIGIFIGIASIVALIGLGEGLNHAINSQFGFLGTDILSVMASGGFGPPGTGVVKHLTDKELNEIKKVQGVIGAAGRIIEPVKITFNKKTVFSYAISQPDKEDRKIIEHVMQMKAQKGRLLEDGDKGVVFLGASFYEDDKLFGKPVIPGSKITIQNKDFTVIGIMDKKGNFQFDAGIFLNDDDMRSLFNTPSDQYDVIGVQFNQNADVKEIQADIEKKIRKIRDEKIGEEDFSVQTPASILATVNSVLLGVQIFVYIIAGISLLVGGIGIMNTMYTAVVERTKEIGIMKSIGARNSTIFTLFFIESGLLGSIGGGVGALMGASFAIALSYVGKLILGSDLIAAQISWQLFFGSILFSFLIGSFFGTTPAIRASKLNPVDALRHSK